MNRLRVPSSARRAVDAPPRGQHGATMLELLVSLLILAFGILGLIGMMTRTVGNTHVSMLRSQAAVLTDDIFDRMRTDSVNVRAGKWTTRQEDVDSETSMTLARQEIAEWQSQVRALLPDGNASIAMSGGLVTVTISWQERGGSTPSLMSTVSAL